MHDNCKEQIKQLEEALKHPEVDMYNLKCLLNEVNYEMRNTIADLQLRVKHLENVCDLDDGS